MDIGFKPSLDKPEQQSRTSRMRGAAFSVRQDSKAPLFHKLGYLCKNA